MIDVSSVQWLVGKNLTQTIQANLRRKFPSIYFLEEGDDFILTVIAVIVRTNAKGKITSITSR